MTTRYSALTVVLENDMREDDAEGLLNAIRQLRGVRDVQGHVTDTATLVAETRIRHELGQKLWEVIFPSTSGKAP